MKAFESTTEKEKNGLSLQHEQKSAPAIQCKGYEARTSYPLPPVQRKPNRTGLPDPLKTGVENLSGFSMDDVQVHYNSNKPAQLEALAYAQGTDIHVAPGQEQHLPHEAWHVVQQKQGRVQPTMQVNAKIGVNDDKGLEQEADKMGQSAMRTAPREPGNINARQLDAPTVDTAPIQLFKFRPRFLSKNPKYNTTSLTPKNSGTASETYDVTTDKTMGSSGTKIGVGKRGIDKTPAYPESAYNLGMDPDTDPNPRMIARQVATNRLAKKLGLSVISKEKFASHTDSNTNEKELIAISAMVGGNSQSIKALHGSGNIRQSDVTPSLQKQFSDLQLLDALAGQTDRHVGNMYIDYANQKLKGIDNDQAFPANNYYAVGNNALPSFAVGKRNEKEIEYKQSQIDAKTAAKILKLKSRDLPKILNSAKGEKAGEVINKEEIETMKLRLEAMKLHIKDLKKNKKLIKKWDNSTLHDALNEEDRGVTISHDGSKPQIPNYIKRIYS